MERAEQMIKSMIQRFLRHRMVLLIAEIIAGLVLMIWRGQVVEQMIRVVGYILIAAAAAYIVFYFTGGRRDEMLLGYAALSGAAGALLVLLSGFFLRAFPILAGCLMILSSAAGLYQMMNSIYTPWYSKALSVLVLLLGILILIHPGTIANAIVFCIGAAFMVNGISGLIMIYKV